MFRSLSVGGLLVLVAGAACAEVPLTTVVPSCHAFDFAGQERLDAIKLAPEGLYAVTNVALHLTDPRTRKTLKSRALPNRGYCIAVGPDALYLGETATPQVQVLDRDTLATVRTLPLPVVDDGRPYPHDLAVHGDQLYVATFQKVLVVNRRTGALEHVLPMPENSAHTSVWSVAVDGDQLYYTWPSGGAYRYDIPTGVTTHFERSAYQAGNGMVFGLPECAKGITAAGDRVYVSDEWHGIAVYRKDTGKLERYMTFNESNGCMMWTQMNAVVDGVVHVENAEFPVPAAR